MERRLDESRQNKVVVAMDGCFILLVLLLSGEASPIEALPVGTEPSGCGQSILKNPGFFHCTSNFSEFHPIAR